MLKRVRCHYSFTYYMRILSRGANWTKRRTQFASPSRKNTMGWLHFYYLFILVSKCIHPQRYTFLYTAPSGEFYIISCSVITKHATLIMLPICQERRIVTLVSSMKKFEFGWLMSKILTVGSEQDRSLDAIVCRNGHRMEGIFDS